MKVVRALKQDIDVRFETTKKSEALVVARNKNNKETTEKPKEPCHYLPKYSPTAGEKLLNYSLPSDLRPGGSFTLWPPQTFNSSTALRVNYRPEGSGGVAFSGISKNIIRTRREWENQQESLH